MDKIKSLNALRGLAALLVAIDHTVIFTLDKHEGLLFYVATFLGSFGVGAFFLLSGFVIFSSLEKTGTREFIVQRIFRIYPVIFAAIVLRYASQIHMGTREFNFDTLKLVLLNASLFGNLFIPIEKNIEPIIWSLTIEMKFYILMALLMALARGNLRQRIFPYLALTACGLALASSHYPPISKPALGDLGMALSALPILFIGTLTCLLYKKILSFGQVCILGGIFLFAFSYAPFGFYVSFEKEFSSWIGAAVVFWLCVFSERVQRWSDNSALLFLGMISYPLYAIHSAVVEFMIHAHPQSTMSAQFLRSLVVSVAVAYIMHKVIETPIQRWSKSIVFRPRPGPSLPIATQVPNGTS